MKNADRYIGLGFTIIPQNKKVPFVKWQQYQDRKPTQEEISNWKRDHPMCGIGAVTGSASGFLVLDIDGGAGWRSIAGKEIPNTWTSKTPRGMHYFFRWEPRFSELVTSKTGILPGVDVKGQGGLVTLPNIEEGRWWVKGHSPEKIPLATAPQWLIELISHRKSVPSNPPGWIADAFKEMHEGNRNETFTSIVGKLHRNRWSKEDIFGLLSPHADVHGFSHKELKGIIESISRYPQHKGESVYEIVDGQICVEKFDATGSPRLESLCNFEAYATEEIIKDDGQELVRAIAIEGKLANGPRLPKVIVPLAEFGAMRWVAREWGLKAIVRAGQSKQDQLREGIQRLSPKMSERRIYIHTGWREIGEKWVYLHANGAVGSDSLNVELESSLDNYALPSSYTGEQLKEAALKTKNLLEICDFEISFPLFAAVHLAPFASYLDLDFTLWLLGSTGSLKSTLASLFLSFFGNFERTSLPTNWESTENALEKKCFTLKDSLLVIDDFAPPSSFDLLRDRERKAQRIIRAVGNKSGRDRLKSDLTSRMSFLPRCFLLATGEQLPTGQSLSARIFSVPCSRARVDLAALTEAQRHDRLLPIYMAEFLSRSAKNFNELVSRLKNDFEKHRATFQGKTHLRIPAMLAWMQVGFDLGMGNLSRHVGEECLTTFKANSRNILEKLGNQQADFQIEERPSRRFLEVLWSLLAQERYCLSTQRGPSALGWRDQQFMYLRPLESYNAVCKFVRDEGGFFGLKATSLHKMLYEDGYLVKTREANRYLGKETCPGQGQVRVLKLDCIKLEAVFGPLPR